MTWAGQSVFALPCGGAGSAEAYAATLNDGYNTTVSDFTVIGNLSIDVTVSQLRAASISLTGNVSVNDVQVGELALSLDGSTLPSVIAVRPAAANGEVTVAVTADAVLAPGTRTIAAVWRSPDNTSDVSAVAGHLHLEVIVAQVVTLP